MEPNVLSANLRSVVAILEEVKQNIDFLEFVQNYDKNDVAKQIVKDYTVNHLTQKLNTLFSKFNDEFNSLNNLTINNYKNTKYRYDPDQLSKLAHLMQLLTEVQSEVLSAKRLNSASLERMLEKIHLKLNLLTLNAN